MHLFITDFELNKDIVKISEERVVKHMGKVLRMEKAENFELQDTSLNDWEKVSRYTVQIMEINKQQVVGKILKCKTFVKKQSKNRKITLCVALPNSGSKLSLITQKLTEVGVDEIVFWKAERSQMKKLSAEKIKKLQKIALEASEQSQRWMVPLVSMSNDIKIFLDWWQVVVFDIDDRMKLDEEKWKQMNRNKSRWSVSQKFSFVGIVWPEGGLSDEDYEKFGDAYILESLGDTVLRMETAAIIAGWKLVNVPTEKIDI